MNNCLLRSFGELNGKVGLLGGTFDPIHNGHIEIAKYAVQAFALDSVILMPTPQNPLKDHGPQASAEERLQLIFEVIKDQPEFQVSTFELYQDGPVYTIDTLRNIKAELKDKCELFLIIGSDNLPSFHEWKDFREIFGLAEIITIARNHFGKKELSTLTENLQPEEIEKLRNNFIVRDLINISSRSLRAEFKNGQIPGDILPPSALNYIKEHHMYGLLEG